MIVWPYDLLTPSNPSFQIRPFSRGGGRSLGGIARTVRTDRGYWVGHYGAVYLRRNRADQRRKWNEIRVGLMGTPGLLVAPICSTNLLGGLDGITGGGDELTVPHDDDTPFDDGAPYAQPGLQILMHSSAPIGATSVVLEVLAGPSDIAGTRFSYNHALYEIGPVLSTPAPGQYQVQIFPAIRAAIPAGAVLEFRKPDCLVHLLTDAEMDIEYPLSAIWAGDINFVEAVDYWNDLAAGLPVEPLP